MAQSPPGTTGIEIGILGPEEHEAALALLVRGMHTNPISLAVARNDPERSRTILTRLFGAAMRHLGWSDHMRVARSPDGAIIGVCGMLAPNTCQSTPRQVLRILPSLVPLGPVTLARTLLWVRGWAIRDTSIPHWHLGPVSVEPHLQGHGIGTALMHAFCNDMDTRGATAWLETDKPANVRFYQRFGFDVLDEARILGVSNWFMLRPPNDPS